MRIFFNRSNKKDSCVSSCIAMMLDKDPEQVYEELHRVYHRVQDADEEFELLHHYLFNNGLWSHRKLECDLDEGLYLVTVQYPSGNHHALLMSIWKGEVKLIDPDMFTKEKYFGFDADSIQPEYLQVVLKVEWGHYIHLHKDKL